MDEINIIKVLKKVKSICSDASLTGSLQGGAAYLVDVMNEVIDKLVAKSVLPKDSVISKRISKEATLDEIGCAAAIIMSYLGNE